MSWRDFVFTWTCPKCLTEMDQKHHRCYDCGMDQETARKIKQEKPA